MNQLSKECIEAIMNEADSFIAHPYEQSIYKTGAVQALENPSIYSKAGLISLEDALGFAEWVSDTFYVTINPSKQWSDGREYKTTAQLFQIYQEQKEK